MMEREKVIKDLEEMLVVVKAMKKSEETMMSYLPIILAVKTYAEIKKELDKFNYE